MIDTDELRKVGALVFERRARAGQGGMQLIDAADEIDRLRADLLRIEAERLDAIAEVERLKACDTCENCGSSFLTVHCDDCGDHS